MYRHLIACHFEYEGKLGIMKKLSAIIGSIILLLAFIIPFAIHFSNDYAAIKTAKQIADIPLPEQTEYMESVHLAGKLTGNGNGMQYFGAILVKSDLTMDELAEYYQNFNNDSQEYSVDRQMEKEIQAIEHGTLSFKTDIQGDNYYIVYSWGDNNNFASEFDLRGH